MALKAELRKTYLAKRRALSVEEVAAKSRQIADLFFSEFAPQAGETVHVFLPIQQHREINTWLLVHQIWEQYPGVQVAVPVANPADFSMTHYLLTPETELRESLWGIPEPVHALPLPESEITTVLVPLLAFDCQGHRVGYGKGFYDRFLALIPSASQKIGLALEPPVERIDDVHRKDLTLDAVITPQAVFRF
ncbi:MULTISPECIES: 5-formyltetrahydrofolate cyclo-ligase [Rufibacter]|uniref:5-formyltetrahydrofolate cyclo-ligase n=1 Tax=Rufibacter quisquiliarum TaxID=1549639 RepID=A0A839GI81_9BACT|nr:MULTISPECIES: 5-formyltetrahydrofolate cyclo-ligase [Rufibacter]MBA9079354.1 5-formyltetrahydrofolate cyclo-ligase [Rufibacter quisquiliarum]